MKVLKESKGDITSFRGKNRFLSNFYEYPITYKGITYPSAEHAFQAAKTDDIGLKQKIANMKDCLIVKRYGRKVPLIPNWDNIKLDVMKDVLMTKFNDPELKQKLIDTKDAYLAEGNNWGDTYWGTVDGEGQNWLGKILMEIRKEIS